MAHPIKLRGRFATVRDTAEALGVSASRTRELIDMVRKTYPATALRANKNRRRHAETRKKKNGKGHS
jgi:hypothetical protein